MSYQLLEPTLPARTNDHFEPPAPPLALESQLAPLEEEEAAILDSLARESTAARKARLAAIAQLKTSTTDLFAANSAKAAAEYREARAKLNELDEATHEAKLAFDHATVEASRTGDHEGVGMARWHYRGLADEANNLRRDVHVALGHARAYGLDVEPLPRPGYGDAGDTYHFGPDEDATADEGE